MNLITNNKSIFAILLLAALLTGCSSSEKPGRENNTEDSRTEVVRVISISSREIARSISHTAHLQAYREVHLAPATPGRIDRILVDAGQNVAEGQLLVEMDRTQLHQAMVQLEQLKTEYRRIDTLRRVGSVSRQQYDQIKTQYELAMSNVAFLEENTQLRAPFPGSVSDKYYEDGEMFSGAPNTPAGKAAVLSLVQTEKLRVMINVAERHYPGIRKGMHVHITSDIYPGEVFTGTVKTVYPTIDAATRTFRVEVSLPNPKGKLRPGMFARAVIELGEEQAFVLPSLAVLKQQGTNERVVFIEENGRAKRVVVETGARFDDMIEIISDQIHEGDRLIVAGQARLLDGMQVSVIE